MPESSGTSHARLASSSAEVGLGAAAQPMLAGVRTQSHHSGNRPCAAPTRARLAPPIKLIGSHSPSSADQEGFEHSLITSTVLSGKQRFPCSEAVFRWHLRTKANGLVRTPACRLHRCRVEARRPQAVVGALGRKVSQRPGVGCSCSIVNEVRYGTLAACQILRNVRACPERPRSGGSYRRYIRLALAPVRVRGAGSNPGRLARTPSQPEAPEPGNTARRPDSWSFWHSAVIAGQGPRSAGWRAVAPVRFQAPP